MNKPHALADQVLQRLTLDRWIKGSMYGRGSADNIDQDIACLTGHINQVCYYDDEGYVDYKAHHDLLEGRRWFVNKVADTIRELYPDRTKPKSRGTTVDVGGIQSFNDHPDTQLDDVVVVMEKVKVQLQEQDL